MKGLREAGEFRLTPQRLAILKYLDGRTDHPSAEEVYRAVRRKFPTMSLATVYNTLEALKGRGRLRELLIDPQRKRFDPDIGPHHHLMCVRCSRIVDVRLEEGPTVPGRNMKGFEVLGVHMEFYGVCPACRRPGLKSRERSDARV